MQPVAPLPRHFLEARAVRFAAHAEVDKAGHIVWVKDEDQIAKAKEILAQFRLSPDDPRYQGVESSAESIRREEERRRREKAANVVEMRGRWGSGAAFRRRCPAVIAMIAASVLIAILTNAGEPPFGALLRNIARRRLLILLRRQTGRSSASAWGGFNSA